VWATGMWIDRLTSSRTTHAIELAAQFSEQRQRVLAENLANIDTPDYHIQQLDPEVFQVSLRKALDQAQEKGERRLKLRDNAQFATAADGTTTVQPTRSPAANALFHDGTNARMEQLLSDVTANSLSYDLSTSLLRNKLDGLIAAIRGRV
jgi:flagellar basal-body rod protein FlgB